MGIVTGTIDWLASTRQYASEKFRTPRKAPPYVATELGDYGDLNSMWESFSEDQRMAAAARVSWIYANIVRIGNEVSASEFNIYKRGTNEKDIDHEFERIMAYPNEFFDGKTLLKYTIWGLSLDKNGAFWFIAPDSKTGKPREIWPIPMGKMTPVKDANKFISHYIYTANNGEKLAIRKEYICRFIYPHPEDMWLSFPPLAAAGLPIAVYEGVTTAQKDMFTQSRGTPLSVLSLDANISEPDFARARQRIRDDWASERKIAIVRAGSLNTQVVGLSNRDLEVIAAQEFTRDELDAIFMNGIQWHKTGSSTDYEEINKAIKDIVIYPLHLLIAAQVQIHIITPFYGPEFKGEFDDIRAQDRSLTLQENTIYFRSMSFDESRAAQGMAAFKNELLEGYGELPYSLANNPSFVLQYYGIGKMKDPGEKPEEIGNLEDSLDQEQVVDQLAEADSPDEPAEMQDDAEEKSIDVGEAMVEGIAVELRRYRKVLLRDWRKNGDTKSLVNRQFDTAIIPDKVMQKIKEHLHDVSDEDGIKYAFAEWLQ